MSRVPIVDAHLDMAYNAQRGRDHRLTAHEIRGIENADSEQCMVTFPELRRGGVALIVASVFVSPGRTKETTDFEFNPKMAETAKVQMSIYQIWEDEGLVKIIRSAGDLRDHLTKWEDDPATGMLINMESAEPIRDPAELSWWHDRGVRMIGPAWGCTRYCGGFAGKHGLATGYTSMGRELMAGMKDLHIPLDLAHSSVESFWEALESDLQNVCCTHTAPREVIGVDRMPNAEQVKALAARRGMIGIGLGNAFVVGKGWGDGEERPRDVPLSAVGDALKVWADAGGWDHVGIGSDLDGGLGLEESPLELDTAADLYKVGDVVPPDARTAVLGGNWLSFLEASLP